MKPALSFLFPALALVLLPLAVSCGGKDETGSDTDTDTDMDTDTDTDDGDAASWCAQSCSAPSECVLGTYSTVVTDEDNYACEDSVCTYTGCNNDGECQEAYYSQDYACADASYAGGEGGYKTCVPTCSVAADCAMGVAAYDEDNYTCDGGKCKYTGCNDDTECQAMGGDLVCRSVDGWGVKACVNTCAAPADCAFDDGAYSEDNWACNDSLCSYLGCSSSEECQASSTDYLHLDVCVE